MLYRPIILGMLALLLSSCANYGTNLQGIETRPSGTEAELMAGDSIVTVSFRSNLHDNNLYGVLLVYDLDSGTPPKWVSALNLPLSNAATTSLFSFALKPGHYQLAQLRSSSNRDYYWYLGLGKDLKFTVGSEQYIDLGSVIITQVANNAAKSFRDPADAHNDQLLKEFYPGYATILHFTFKKPDTVSGWDKPVAADEFAIVSLTKTLSQFILNSDKTAGGSLSGSSFGQVLFRSDSGSWKNINLGNLNLTQWVSGKNPEDFFALTEMNALLHYHNAAVDRIALPENADKSSVKYFGQAGDDLLVALTRNAVTRIYRASPEENWRWHELASMGTDDSKDFFKSPTGGLLARRGDLFVLAAPDSNLYFYNLVDGKVSSTPQKSGMGSIPVILPDGKVLLSFVGFLQAKLNISADRGATWTELDVPGRSTVIAADNGALYRMDADGKVWKSTDEGGSWSMLTQGFYGDLWTVGNTLFMKTYLPASGAVQAFSLAESPAGAAWVMERDTSLENAVAKLQKAARGK